MVASQLTLCSLHHTLAHEGRFGVRVTDDGVFVFTRPDGRSIRPSGSGREASEHDERFRGIVASAPPIGDAGLDAFEATIRSQILVPIPAARSTHTRACCKWLGERMDYNTAISASVVTPSGFEGMQFREAAAVVARTMAESQLPQAENPT